MSSVCDELLFAGDAVYEYRMSNEIVDVIRDAGIRAILGNHETQLLSPNGARARQVAGVREDAVEFLRGLPYRLELELDGKRVLLVHGSPVPPYDDYVSRGT